MKQVTAEIMKGARSEAIDMKEMVVAAEQNVATIEMQEQEAEQALQSLELELMEAQASRERTDETEQKGKETSEKIGEATG